MKRSPFQHPPAPAEEALTGPRYWRSLDELSGHPAFQDWMHREFQDGASESTSVNRRQFVKLMAASFALTGVGLAGCRRPEAYIKPFGKETLREIPGLPVFYATSKPGSRENLPLVAETHGSRPTKLEGNDLYKPYGGATDLQSQAAILDLYDPDRATKASRGTATLSQAQVADLLKGIHDDYARVGGQGLAILVEPSTSPTRARMLADLKSAFPRILIAEYEAIASNNAELAAAQLFGRSARPLYNFANSKRILALDSDFLNSGTAKLGNSRDFASTRRVKNKVDAEKMSRLYSVESNFTVTGTMADHRLRLATAQMPAFAALVAVEVCRQLGVEQEFANQLELRIGSFDVDKTWVKECVTDLIANKGHSVIVPGDHLPVETHLLCAMVNDLISGTGKTVRYVSTPDSSLATIRQLAESIKQGTVDTLIVLGGNPAYDAPADLEWASLQKSVKNVVRYGYYYDETSLLAQVHIPATHFLESWSDGRAADGTLLPVQPMILPLFEGVQEVELLGHLLGQSTKTPYDQVYETFSQLTTEANKQTAFARFLRDGYLPDSSYETITASISASTIKSVVAKADISAVSVSAQSLEVRFVADAKVGDGRYNNNGWLQECPDPMTKLTWDNAILVSPALAEHLGFDTKSGEFLIGGVSKKLANFKRGRQLAPLAKLTVNGVTLSGPIHILPGLADWTVVVPLGYGRTKVGKVGQGTGFSAYPAVKSDSPSLATGATLTITSETYNLANTQEHWSLEGRDIIREGNVSDFTADTAFAQRIGLEAHSPPVYGKDQDKSLQYKATNQPRGNSLYETPVFTALQQWGMSVDLNTCTGCNACVVACQAENNIPIVGKDQVMRGREMHWIRLDRYFSSGDVKAQRTEIPRDPQASVMPMMCQHCEMAPCEQVCPVNATVHDEQGLNVMAYNRCVGTRYCANNCPYKVRRFNFFDWNRREIGHFYEGPFGPNKEKMGATTELIRMRANPEVTVRMRGVMEKCTFCQQRIQNTKIAQKVKTGIVDGGSDDIKVPDGLIRTACQQVCPTGAIVFGDIADESSAVSQAKDNDRDYAVLGYLNVRPRTTYLARLRNPNPKMPVAAYLLKEYKQLNSKGGHDSHGHGDTNAPPAGEHHPADASHG